MSLSHTTFWIQVRGLQFEMLLEEARADIRNRIGRFISNDEWKATSEQTKYLRVRVEVPIDKPLWRGVFVTSSKGDKVWIDYRYERLSSFCYRCGRLGHEERNCEKQSEKEGNEPPQYGEWLKASFGGKMMEVLALKVMGVVSPRIRRGSTVVNVTSRLKTALRSPSQWRARRWLVS